MRSLSVRLLLLVLVLVFVPVARAHDVTLTGTTTFAALDGSSSDHDGAINGVFTVSDGSLIVNGVVNCNDDVSESACAMTFSVSGNVTINDGGALYAENRTGGGSGGAITLMTGGNLVLNGNSVISTASRSSSGATGGAITANVAGNVTLAAGSTIDSGASNARGGAILIGSAGTVAVGGNVLSGPSRTLLATRLTGSALDGGTANQIGGAITIASTTFAEPALLIGTNANVISQGQTNGAGPVTLDGCGIEVRGLVAAISHKEATAKVAIRSGKSILIDGRDLAIAAGTRKGRVRADAPDGTAANMGVDIFASEGIEIRGPVSTYFAVTSMPGVHTSRSYGGTIRITSIGDGVTASGNAIDAGRSASGDTGGNVDIAAKTTVNLDGASIAAVGDFNSNNTNRGGGSIHVRSYSGDVLWTNGLGEVRPVGSTSGLATADQGSIVLTACGVINTTASSFPVMGVATSMFPETHAGVCSPAAPSLPIGVPSLVTCNTPPVANDFAASTNEDTAITLTLSGTDVDGDALTFSIVTPPAKGTLGPIVSTGPTTATVNYTPSLNTNGTDSFTYQANDGNGGTDNATVTITVAPVNDAPSFLVGPTVTVLEDGGAQTYANWASSISAGPADESGQTVTFTVSTSNPSLFSVQPALASNGTLTFTPAANAYGSATINVVAHDNGGTANGGVDTSASQSSTISVSGVNDEPSFVAGANQSVLEDASPQTVANWATSISAGPNETQTLSFVVSSNNPALFSAGPSIASNGTLTYTPAANANGTATVSVAVQDDGGTANGGDDTSSTQTFTITVTAVNDAPSFTSGGNVSVNEDSGAYSAPWATAISAGPADESTQALTFSIANDNNALFSSQPSLDASGNLTFTLAANAFGSAIVTVSLSDDGGSANGGTSTSAMQSFTITVSAVNDEPSFSAGGNVTVSEDSGSYSSAWASAISAGPGETQTLTFVASNDNNSLFASQPAISAAGTLMFTPSLNANGTATITVVLHDDGGTANGGDDTSSSVTFTIDVTPVNDEPSFVSGGNVTVNEDSGAYSAAWASAISAGPANETSQTVTFVVSSTNNALFSVAPSISPSGVLTFVPAVNAFGSSTVTVVAKDDGGTASGGDDTSATETFTLTVSGVNDAPSFNSGGNVTVNEDSGVYAAAWATAISAGAGEAGQSVSFSASNDNNTLFAAQPAISSSGVLTFTPSPNAYGVATVSVYAQDNGGTANGGVDTSAVVTFTITVNGVNDPPAAGNDSWETLGNTELRVDLGLGTTPNVGDATASGSGVLDNDADTVEGDPFAITGVVGCADSTAPYVCVVTGGTVTLNANGTFSFQPSAGATSGSFQYVVTDSPAAGSPATAVGTVSISMQAMIWYVNGSAAAGGNGTSSSPFNSFTSLNGSGDVDGNGDYLFVHSSSLSGSIALEGGQHLLGEGVGLILPLDLNGNGAPTTVVAAGTRPNVSNSGDVVSVPGVSAEVAGLSLSSSTGNAIDVTSTFFSATSVVSIHDNVISSAGTEGIDVNAGSVSGTTVSANNNVISSNGTAFDFTGSLGANSVSFTNGSVSSISDAGLRVDAVAPATVTITGLTNVIVDGNTGGDGIRVSNATFDADATTASFELVNAGSISVGSSANPVGGAAVTFTNVSGNVAFGTLSAHGTTSGVSMTGAGLFTGTAGFQVSAGGGEVRATTGRGLSATNVSIGAANFQLTRVDSNGGANGIALNNTGNLGALIVSGAGTAGSGGTIANSTGAGILLASTKAPSFSWMSIQNSGGDGVSATSVDGFSLISSTVSDTTGVAADDGLDFDEVTGNVTIANSTITSSPSDNLDVFNSSGSAAYTITGSTFSNAIGNNGINFTAAGTAVVTSFSLTGSTLSGNFADGAQVSSENTAQIQSSVISGNTIRNNNIGLDVTQNGTSTHTFVVDSNTFNGHKLQAINIFSGAATPAGGIFSGKVRTNTIGTSGVAGSGSVLGNGMRININGGAHAKLLIDGNVIRQTPNGRGIEVIGRNGNGGLDATITGNDVNPQDTSGFPLAAIFVQSNCVSVCNTVRADIRGNIVPLGSTTEVQPTYLALLRSGASTLQLVDSPPADASCTAQLLSNNTGSAGASSGCALIAGPISTP